MKWICVTNAREWHKGSNLYLLKDTIIGLEETEVVLEVEPFDLVPGCKIICFANGTESDFDVYETATQIKEILDKP